VLVVVIYLVVERLGQTVDVAAVVVVAVIRVL
jgi:hypothetical protein